MKMLNKWSQVLAAVVAVSGAMSLMAQDAAVLTRSQWLKKVGASVTEQGVLQDTMQRMAPGDKVEFAQKVLKATTRLPVEPAEKSAALVKSAVGVIGGVNGGDKSEVIAEVFATVPLEYLPVVTEELAKRFDQEYNQLTDAQYEQIATNVLQIATRRNTSTDTPSVRNTFAILAFLRGARDESLKNRMISLLPDERQRNLAAAWIPPALNSRDYSAMLAASDVEPLEIRQDLLLSLVGRSNLDRLLADLTANLSLKPETMDVEGIEGVEAAGETVWVPLSQVRATGGIIGSALSGGQMDHAPGYGINRVPAPLIERCPCPYQGQGTSIVYEIPVSHR